MRDVSTIHLYFLVIDDDDNDLWLTSRSATSNIRESKSSVGKDTTKHKILTFWCQVEAIVCCTIHIVVLLFFTL